MNMTRNHVPNFALTLVYNAALTVSVAAAQFTFGGNKVVASSIIPTQHPSVAVPSLSPKAQSAINTVNASCITMVQHDPTIMAFAF
jgi:hypothetical protein